MKKTIGSVFIAFVLLFPSISMAADFCVGSSAELQAALTAAGTNSQADLIKVRQGTYKGNFMYAFNEAFGVTMEGGYSDSNGKLLHIVLNAMLDKENPYGEEDLDKLSSHVAGGHRSHTQMAQNLAKLKLLLSEFHPGIL